MGKPDALDRLVQIMIALVSLFSLVNGGFMVWSPHDWYQSLPTVHATGSFNQHFVRDIGFAYVTCAILLGFAARFPSGRWLAALAGGLWLTLHGAFHVWEVLGGVGTAHNFWMDAPGVLGPPLLVWCALGILLARRRIAPAGGALDDGVPQDLVNRALASKPLDGDLQIAFDLGRAIARQSADALSLGETIQAKYGRIVRLELAMTAATVRAYPGMKRGLGLTTACAISKLEV